MTEPQKREFLQETAFEEDHDINYDKEKAIKEQKKRQQIRDKYSQWEDV